jgi:hypothetical protein
LAINVDNNLASGGSSKSDYSTRHSYSGVPAPEVTKVGMLNLNGDTVGGYFCSLRALQRYRVIATMRSDRERLLRRVMRIDQVGCLGRLVAGKAGFK